LKFARELISFVDFRLALITAATALVGFGAAKWNELRPSTDATGEIYTPSIAYEVGFGQGVAFVLQAVILAAVLVGLAAIISGRNSKRLAVQLTISTAIFAALNLAMLVVQP